MTDLTLDHELPVSRGGRSPANRGEVLCRSCNAQKGARLVTYVELPVWGTTRGGTTMTTDPKHILDHILADPNRARNDAIRAGRSDATQRRRPVVVPLVQEEPAEPTAEPAEGQPIVATVPASRYGAGAQGSTPTGAPESLTTA